MPHLSRLQVFAAISILAAIFGIAAYRATRWRMDGVWGQLFWLTLGVLFTTFLLESLLTKDVERRRRLEDGFAFRTFASSMLARLAEMVGDDSLARSIASSAVKSPTLFAVEAAQAANVIRIADGFCPDIYQLSYIDFQGGLKDLGRNYIRLVASSRDEMSAIYIDLLDIAQRWVYFDPFSEGARESLNRAQEINDHTFVEQGRLRFAAAQGIAQALVRETADMLADLSCRATQPGVPARP